ncbi:MAG: DUF2809 domain-containing protein [Clostridia bacterium]|nr:DUF2809 domain-containing protein [Clostridia bacterium]
MSDKNKRISALFGFILLLAVEIIIGKFAHGFLRAYGGDVLVIPLIYCLVRMFYVRHAVWLPAAVGGLGILAEVLQYFNLCGLLGISKGSLLGILLGSSADFADILCYAAGTLLIYAAEWIILKIWGRCDE